MCRYLYFFAAALMILACSGEGESDDRHDIDSGVTDNNSSVDFDNTETDKESSDKESSDNDGVEVRPVKAVDNCSGDIEFIDRLGKYTFDTSVEGFSNSYAALCSNYINGRDAVYGLKIEKPSRVVVEITEAPNDDSTLFIGTECGKADTGCNEDMDESTQLSHLVLDLAPGDYYLVFDSVDKKENEESRGVFKFTVEISDDPCSPNPCKEAGKSTCENNKGNARCVCDAGFHEEVGKCVVTECAEIDLNDFSALQNNGVGYDYTSFFATNIGVADKKDVMMTRFIGEQKEGVYKLGEGDNKNSFSCRQCVIALEDMDKDAPAAKTFFAVTGTVDVENAEFSDEGFMTGVSKGSLKGVKMLETTKNNTGSWDTLYKKGGSCLKIKDTSWDTYCYPSCETEDGTPKMCGSDGCGGICGKPDACGGVDEQCSEDGTRCEAYSCKQITPERIWFKDIQMPYYTIPFRPLLGDPTVEDNFVMTLTPATAVGVHNLSEGKNKLLSECEECLVLMEDFQTTPIGINYTKFFFQQKGFLHVDEIKPNADNNLKGQSKGRLEDVRLVQVVVNHENNSYTQVQGGECVEIKDSSWDTFCTPSCKTADGKTKICGSDGCGGVCGSCEKSEWCSTDQLSCEERVCTKITDVNFTRKSGSASYHKYEGTFSPSIGDVAIPDLIKMTFSWKDGTSSLKKGTFDLGSSENSINRKAPYIVTILEDFPLHPLLRSLPGSLER